MNRNDSSRRGRRLAFMLSGLIDALIGVGLLLIGFRILPLNIGVQNWIVILIGAVMAVAGASMAIYNFSRLDE